MSLKQFLYGTNRDEMFMKEIEKYSDSYDQIGDGIAENESEIIALTNEGEIIQEDIEYSDDESDKEAYYASLREIKERVQILRATNVDLEKSHSLKKDIIEGIFRKW